MERFRIRTRYQREEFATRLARELQKSPDVKTAALGHCIEYVLSAPIELVHGAVLKLLRDHPEMQEALDMEVSR